MGRIRHAKLAVLLILLAGGLGARLIDGVHDRWALLSSRDPGERWKTAREDLDTRLRRTLGSWSTMHAAVLEHTPRDATVIIFLPEEGDSRELVLRIGFERKLLFPRGVNGYETYVAYYRERPEALAPNVFLVNLDPRREFLGQEAFEELVRRDDFTLWQYRGVL